jgi:uncharacterized protein YciI
MLQISLNKFWRNNIFFTVKIFDIENSGPLRDQYRESHLDYLEKFDQQTIFAGPILTEDLNTELGSYRILDLPDRDAVDQHIANEPYIICGAQYGPEIFHWSASMPYTWRNCPRKIGNIQYLIHAIDKPNSKSLRNQLRSEHEAYQARVKHLYITRGPLLNDDGGLQIGSLMIIDVPDIASAKKFWEDEPFVKGKLFERVEFYGWRFGRRVDKFKL